jgi:hypothetical protein
VVTSGGQLKAQWIIHAAVNPLGLWADPKSVRNATRAALKKAEEKQVKRLAFPAIGTGAGALPVERCADILIDEVLRHCGGETLIEEVMFVLYDEKPYAIFEERFNQRMNPAPPPPPPSAAPGDAAAAQAGKPAAAAPTAPPPPPTAAVPPPAAAPPEGEAPAAAPAGTPEPPPAT